MVLNKILPLWTQKNKLITRQNKTFILLFRPNFTCKSLTLLGSVPSFNRVRGSDCDRPIRIRLKSSSGCPLLFLMVGLPMVILGRLPSPDTSNTRDLPRDWLWPSPSMAASNIALKLWNRKTYTVGFTACCDCRTKV